MRPTVPQQPPSPIQSRTRLPLRTWSGSKALAELAMLVDALPAAHREAIVQACLGFASSECLAHADLVMAYRSAFLNCLAESVEPGLDVRWLRRVDFHVLQPYLAPIGRAQDPAQTTLALCDLIQAVVDALATLAKPRTFMAARGGPGHE